MKLEADKIGYPILIKPTHGGGGKGMRIVLTPDEFVESFLAAQRETAASFGVNTILLEKYITRPSHIEVQLDGSVVDEIFTSTFGWLLLSHEKCKNINNTVSMHYDPMITKLVVWGENRAAALVKLEDCLSKFQVAGLPTNINFLLKLANHWVFENGNVETHFIDNYKEDLFVDTTNLVSAKEAYGAGRLSASLMAACLIEKELFTLARNPPGGSSLLPVWYASPPFRVHHQAKRTMELEWDNEYGSGNSKILKLTITYQPDGRYLIETEENGSPILEVKATYVKDDYFRVEVDGVSNDVNLVVYSMSK